MRTTKYPINNIIQHHSAIICIIKNPKTSQKSPLVYNIPLIVLKKKKKRNCTEANTKHLDKSSNICK